MHGSILATSLVLLLAATASADLLCLTNIERQKAGLRPLRYSQTLTNAAQAHSADMARNNFMSHTGSDGSSPWARLAAAGFTNMQTAGENVAAGQTTESQVMNDWMNSPGHRANILSPSFTLFGWSRVGNYWTQDFGATFNDDPSIPPICPGAPAPPPPPPPAPAPAPVKTTRKLIPPATTRPAVPVNTPTGYDWIMNGKKCKIECLP